MVVAAVPALLLMEAVFVVNVFLAGCKEECKEDGRFLISVDVLDLRGPAGRLWRSDGCGLVVLDSDDDVVTSGFLV